MIRRRGHLIGLDREGRVPGGQTLLEWFVAREERIEIGGRGAEDRIVDPRHGPVEVQRDERVVRDRIAGGLACLRLESDELGPEPLAPLRVIDLGREAPAEGPGITGERRRRAEGLDVRRRLQVGRTVVGVYQARAVLVEAEDQLDVVAGDAIGSLHGTDAADGRNALDHRSPGSCVSPTNGMPSRSTASRLIRRTAVLAAATSRT